MGVRAVFFDAGETLVHPAPTFQDLFAAVVTREGHPRDPQAVRDGLSMISGEFVRAARANEQWTTSPERSRRFWTTVYGRFLEALGIPTTNGLTAVLYEAFTDLGNYDTFDDVRPALENLRAGGTDLGVISNFEPWLEDLLERLELSRFFPVRVISGLDGVAKPDLAIFRLALERAGLRPEEAAYVGDAPDFDMEPAAELGMFPVLIDRRGRHDRFTGPGIRITDLADLPSALRTA